jgi:hypothetical protein
MYSKDKFLVCVMYEDWEWETTLDC